MGLGFEGASDYGEKKANFLAKEGTFLFVCTRIDEALKGIPGAWGIEAIVKGVRKGDEDELGKTCGAMTMKFTPPKPTDKDGGEFKKKIQIRAAVALGWVRPRDLKPNEGFHVDDTSTASGRLFIATIKRQDKKHENDPPSKYFELDSNKIYHIDDPHVNDFPIPPELLKLVPADARIPAEEFAVFEADGNQNKGGSTPPSGAGKLDDDLAEL